MNPTGTIGLELFGAGAVIVLTIVRVWIQGGRRPKPAQYAYEVCLFLALVCNLYITSIDVWSSWREKQLRSTIPNPTQRQLSAHLQTEHFMKCFFAVGICYSLFLWLVKGSFIALYFEISGHFQRRVKLALFGVTAFVVASFVANITLKFVWCLPFRRNWELGPHICTFAIALPVNSCTAFFNIATDLALLSLFGLIVYSLQLRHRELLAAVFISCIGTCTVIAAAVRYAVAYTSFKDSDATWSNTKELLLWTNVEMGLVMLAVTLPAFRRLLRSTSSPKQYAGYSAQSDSDNRGVRGVRGVKGNTTLVGCELRQIDELPDDRSSHDSRRQLRDDVELCNLPHINESSRSLFSRAQSTPL